MITFFGTTWRAPANLIQLNLFKYADLIDKDGEGRAEITVTPGGNPAMPSSAQHALDTSGQAAPTHRWRKLLRLAADIRQFTRHHGIWAPGVRLLRNLNLATKAALVLACIGLPLLALVLLVARTELQGYSQARGRLHSFEQMQALRALETSMLLVRGEALRAELGTGGSALAGALAADQAQFNGFAAALEDGPLPDRLRSAWQSLRLRRDAMLAQAANGSTQALPGRGGARLEAMADYSLELTTLRVELARGHGITADAPGPVRALHDAAIRSLPKLRWLVARSLGVGAPLYESSDRPPRAQRLAVLSTQAEVLLEAASADLDYAVAQGMFDRQPTRPMLAAVRQQVDYSLALARSAAAATNAAEVVAGASLDRTSYLDAGSRALQAAEGAEAAAMNALLQWSRQQADLHQGRLFALGAAMAAWLLLAGYLLACTYRVLAGGLDTLCTHLDRIGHGDLSQLPQGHGRDEIGRALKALGTSTGHMSQLFGAVTQGVAAVSQASREVASGNAGLSSRTAEVRTSITTVSERAEACSLALDTCGDQVEQTAELILGMRRDGERSRKAMGGLRESMARLQVKSREIGQVITLVETIAYQTKLLSINASVEAARAGPAGRGFAVVAHEVRALAQRSEQAAHRIGGIVGASIEEIEAGGIMAERADDAVRSNEERVESVDGLIREAVQLTRTGRSESQAVLGIAREVEESTISNLRIVEQLAQASASLRTQGDDLKRSVQHFVFA